MNSASRLLALTFIAAACSSGDLSAQSLFIPHPDNSSKVVEYFLEKPRGNCPWPTVVFVQGYQDGSRPGGKDFVTWGVLDRFAKRGYTFPGLTPSTP